MTPQHLADEMLAVHAKQCPLKDPLAAYQQIQYPDLSPSLKRDQ
jgi:hypothetical protein